jgi:hypothetical protein
MLRVVFYTFHTHASTFIEKGMKTFENVDECVNCTIAYNDLSNIHQINYEIQAARCLSGYRSLK